MLQLFLPIEANYHHLFKSNQTFPLQSVQLLKVRWSLIQKGHQRKSIRINSQRSCIYVNNQMYGKVVDSQFQQLTSAPATSILTQNAISVQLPDKLLITHDSPVTSDSNSSNSTQKSNWLDHVCLINIRSIVNKINVFQNNVYSRSPDIICVTETWLSDKFLTMNYYPELTQSFAKTAPLIVAEWCLLSRLPNPFRCYLLLT